MRRERASSGSTFLSFMLTLKDIEEKTSFFVYATAVD